VQPVRHSGLQHFYPRDETAAVPDECPRCARRHPTQQSGRKSQRTENHLDHAADMCRTVIFKRRAHMPPNWVDARNARRADWPPSKRSPVLRLRFPQFVRTRSEDVRRKSAPRSPDIGAYRKRTGSNGPIHPRRCAGRLPLGPAHPLNPRERSRTNWSLFRPCSAPTIRPCASREPSGKHPADN
jgi:hypothetical protein